MSEIIFKFQATDFPIYFKPYEKVGTIIDRFCIKANVNKKHLTFLYNNEFVDEESTVKKLLAYQNKKIFIKVSENDEIRIKYKKPKDEKSIVIFGYSFVNNNKNKCKIIYNEKGYELTYEFYIEEKIEEIEIILKGICNITKISSIFNDCSSLISLPDISNWDTSKVTDMNNMFSGCSSLISLPDISNWDTSKVTDMNQMFSGCSSLISLPDISKWDISNVIDMSSLFSGCSSLISLPDISKWDISNVSKIEYMFCRCSSLTSLPDISKWDISNVSEIKIFSGCSSLISLPDISKWDISNVTDMNSLFYQCSSLTSLPDISKWDISNVSDRIYVLSMLIINFFT